MTPPQAYSLFMKLTAPRREGNPYFLPWEELPQYVQLAWENVVTSVQNDSYQIPPVFFGTSIPKQ